MRDYQEVGGLKVAKTLYDFIEAEALPGTGVAASAFWDGFERLIAEYAPQIAAQLKIRDELQAQIDAYHVGHRGQPFDPADYERFLRDIGYLVPEPADFSISTGKVDAEIALVPGPQLVVPVSNARYVLNAANARWGSLYEALYSTDVISPADGGERGKGYNKIRGARVIDWAQALLDASAPLAGASHRAVAAYRVDNGRLVAKLANGSETGLRGVGAISRLSRRGRRAASLLLRNNGLHIETRHRSESRIGADELAGVSDIVVEAALTAIMDLEDSVAAVDAADKVGLYRNFLGLMRGTISAQVEKNGRLIERHLADDRLFTEPDGTPLALSAAACCWCAMSAIT